MPTSLQKRNKILSLKLKKKFYAAIIGAAASFLAA